MNPTQPTARLKISPKQVHRSELVKTPNLRSLKLMSSKRVIDRMVFDYIVTKTSRRFLLDPSETHQTHIPDLHTTTDLGTRPWKNPKAETTNNNNTSSKIDQEAKL